MIIEIENGIVWNTDECANEDARAWIAENVMGVEPTKDKFGRPVKWSKETDTAMVRVTREYINPESGSWAKKRDMIEVEPKNNDAE